MGILRLFFALLPLVFAWNSYADDSSSRTYWELFADSIHDIRTQLARREPPEPLTSATLQSHIDTLLRTPGALDKVLKYMAGEGLLYSRVVLEDLKFILDFSSDTPDEAAEDLWLDQIGFPRLAMRISESQVTELAETLPMRAQTASVALPNTQAAELEGPRIRKGRSVVEAEIHRREGELQGLADQVEKHLDVFDEFLHNSKRLESLVFRVHSAVFGLASVAGLFVASHFIDYSNLSPREWVGMIGGLWAASSGSHFVLWKFFNAIEWLKSWKLSESFFKLRDSWKDLMALSPNVVTQHAAAAASDRPVPGVRAAGAKENAALLALLETPTDQSTNELLGVALQSEENGNTKRADQILKEIFRRSKNGLLGIKARRIRDAIRAKNRLENAILYRQIWVAAFRGLALALGVWALNRGIEFTLPDMVSRWRSVAFAMIGAIGSKRILDFLWQPLKEEKVDTLFNKRRDTLIRSFRALLDIDPSGELVSRMTRCNHSQIAHRYLTEAALVVLEERPSQEVTQTLTRMLEYEMSHPDVSPSSARKVAEAAFRHYRRCQEQLRELIEFARQFNKAA